VDETHKKQMGSGYFHQVGSVPAGCRYRSSSKKPRNPVINRKKKKRRAGRNEETRNTIRLNSTNRTQNHLLFL